MNSIEQLYKAFFTCIQEQYSCLPEQLASINFTLNTDEAKQAFGDISNNAALVLGKNTSSNLQMKVIA